MYHLIDELCCAPTQLGLDRARTESRLLDASFRYKGASGWLLCGTQLDKDTLEGSSVWIWIWIDWMASQHKAKTEDRGPKTTWALHQSCLGSNQFSSGRTESQSGTWWIESRGLLWLRWLDAPSSEGIHYLEERKNNLHSRRRPLNLKETDAISMLSCLAALAHLAGAPGLLWSC